MTVKKVGRPPKDENRDKLKSVTFKLDAETKAALDRLENRITGGSTVGGKRSMLLRKLILDADRSQKER